MSKYWSVLDLMHLKFTYISWINGLIHWIVVKVKLCLLSLNRVSLLSQLLFILNIIYLLIICWIPLFLLYFLLKKKKYIYIYIYIYHFHIFNITRLGMHFKLNKYLYIWYNHNRYSKKIHNFYYISTITCHINDYEKFCLLAIATTMIWILKKAHSIDLTRLVFLLFFLIWPLVPVSGLRFPIFTIAFAKSVRKLAELEL